MIKIDWSRYPEKTKSNRDVVVGHFSKTSEKCKANVYGFDRDFPETNMKIIAGEADVSYFVVDNVPSEASIRVKIQCEDQVAGFVSFGGQEHAGKIFDVSPEVLNFAYWFFGLLFVLILRMK